MNSLEELIAQIPIRHNAVSYVVFTGVAMGFILAATIWVRAPKGNRALHYYALFTLCLSVVTFDTFLCYTGWMKYTLAWNDASEPLTLLLAPFLYLSIRFLILRKPLPLWVLALHILPAVLYALSQMEYYAEPLPVKFNAYKDAYFQDIPFAGVPEGTDYSYQWVKDKQRWLLLLGFAFYGLLTIRLWTRHKKAFGSPAGDVRISKYRFGWYVMFSILATLGILLAVYVNYEDDGGDHFLSLFMSVTTLAAVVAFLSESRFFQGAWLIDKYETAARKTDNLELSDLQNFIEKEAFYTSEDPSLKALARAFNTHPNTISRLINEQTSGNYNDFLNGYRVRLAIERLESGTFTHLTIEAIGQSVGFKSKSSFYEAFKKHTGESPSRYLRSRTNA